MNSLALKRIPEGAVDASIAASPLEQFRDCALAVAEVLARRGVDLSDRTKADDPKTEGEFAAEVRRTFSQSDARTLDAICGFVGKHATETERADEAAAREAADAQEERDGRAEIDVVALQREYTRSPSLMQEFRGLDTYLAFKRAEARGVVRIHGRAQGLTALSREDISEAKRRGRIVAAKRAFDTEQAKFGGRVLCSRRAWVHTALRDAGLSSLTEAEAKQHGLTAL